VDGIVIFRKAVRLCQFDGNVYLPNIHPRSILPYRILDRICESAITICFWSKD
jgi:hypothetical protein